MSYNMNHRNIGPLIINLDGVKLSNNEIELIKNDLVGGVILFSHNYILNRANRILYEP